MHVELEDLEEDDDSSIIETFDQVIEFFENLKESVGTNPKMSIKSILKSGLLSLAVNMPLHIPPWPKMEGMTEAAVMRKFKIQDYLMIEVIPSQNSSS